MSERPPCPEDPSGKGIHWRMPTDPKGWCRACGAGGIPESYVTGARGHAIYGFVLPNSPIAIRKKAEREARGQIPPTPPPPAPPAPGDRDGDTYDHDFDYTRLNAQQQRVFDVMKDGRWHTLGGVGAATGDPEASVSARFRDLRKPQFGGWMIDRRRALGGLFEYRLVLERPLDGVR